MADLSAMYRATAASVPQPDEMMLGGLGMQRIMNNGLQYQQERDNYEAMRGLRALFAQNPEPSISDIGALSPEFAQKYMMNNLAMREKALGIRKTEGEIGRIRSQKLEQDAKFWAPLIGPVAEAHINDPDPSAFRAELGQVIKHGQDMGLDIDPSFDINTATPLQILQIAASRTYKSQYLEAQGAAEKERAISGVAPRPKPEQYYGEASIDPATAMPMRTPPVVGPGAQPGPEAWKPGKPAPRINGHIQPHPRAFQGRGGAQPVNHYAPVPSDFHGEPMTEQDVEVMRQEAERLPPGPEKNKAMQLYEQARRDFDSSLNDEPDERFASPGEVRKERVKVAGDKAAAESTAKLDTERQAERQKFLDLVATFPPVPEVEALLRASTSGAKERMAADAYEAVTGQATPGMAAIGRLKAIQQTLQESMTKLQGDPTLKEVMLKAGAVGDLNNPDIGWNARLEGYRQFIDTLKKKVEQIMGGKPGAPQNTATAAHTPRAQQLIDAHKAKTISDEQFAKEWDALPEGEY